MSVNSRISALSLTIVLCATTPSLAKKKIKTPPPKSPEINLRIVPRKDAYYLYEKLSTTTDFVNVTDKTLCFPVPAQGAHEAATGYLLTSAEALAPTESDDARQERFMEYLCGGVPFPFEKLVSEIEERWIKLAPNAFYTLKSSTPSVRLDVPGQWRLNANYQPPQCSFNIVECSKYLRSAAKSAGCTMPEVPVSAEPVMVNVIPQSDQNSSDPR